MALTPAQRDLALSLDADAPPPAQQAVAALGATLTQARSENDREAGSAA